MGRTLPTFTRIIDSEIESWSKYKRGLRKEDQAIFDDLFRAARIHLAENFYAMRTIPFESIIISMLIEQRKLIKKLQDRMEKTERIELVAGSPIDIVDGVINHSASPMDSFG
ncbi:MAG: hypothetical protein QME58_12290 [Bacteroidota bacterium]|nr:hypothetical protein [Bacteroidota bacterium]